LRRLKMKKIIIFTLFATLIVFHYPLSADSEETSIMEEIVVTATRIEEPKKDVPASIQIITQEDIKNSRAKDVGSLIAEASFGHVQKYPGGLTGRVSLRGFATDLSTQERSRVLVLINGHRAGTVNIAKIPATDIERIEIVKGPASVLYGSSAMGGVINIITKKGTEEGIYSSLGGEVGSWAFWNTTAELSGKKGPFDFFLTGGRSSRDDYDAKRIGTIENSGFNDETVSARFGYSFFNKHHVSLGFQHWRGWNIGSPGATYSPDPDDYSDKKRRSYDIGYETETFSAQYCLIKDEDEWHSGYGEGNSSVTLKKTDTQGVSVQKTFSLNDHRIIVGGQWDRIEVKNTTNTGAPYNPNSRYDTYGIFTEGRLGFLNKKLLLSAGLRYDYFENEILETSGITSLNPKKDTLDHVTVRGGAVYKVTENFRLKGNIGTAFRAPAPDELAADYVSSWGTHYLGNPDLKPEKSVTYDAGIEYSQNSFNGDLSFFHSEFDDKILGVYDSALAARTWENVDGATIQGIEGNMSYDVGIASGLDVSIKPFVNMTYHLKRESEDEKEISQTGDTLLYVPRWTAAYGIKAAQEKWEIRLIANYTGDTKVQDWNYSSTTYGEAIDKDDFTVVHLKTSYRPIKNLEITTSIENIFDSKYEYVLGYPMPRRTFAVGAKWIF
jgi:vitamin B12 transporter